MLTVLLSRAVYSRPTCTREWAGVTRWLIVVNGMVSSAHGLTLHLHQRPELITYRQLCSRLQLTSRSHPFLTSVQ